VISDAVPDADRGAERSAPVRRALLLVLGDFGRSPRMQYHALAFADAGFHVEVVAFRGKPVPRFLAALPQVRLRLLPPLESLRAAGAAAPLAAALRAALHALLVVGALLRAGRQDVVLVQNPPAVPALPLAATFAGMRGAMLVIDWHNLTHAMASLRFGEQPGGRQSFALRLVAGLEQRAGRRAFANLAVTPRMAEHLARHGASRVVLFPDDLPPAPSTAFPLRERFGIDAQTLVAISPTSWSLDEDFDLLLDALRIAQDRGARIAFVATGDGPRRRSFEERAAAMRLTNVFTVWLEPDAFRGALAAADLGVSLHRSAAGVDFPIKIADLFAAGTPVLSLENRGAIASRVREGDGALLFHDAGELAGHLVALDGDRPALARLKSRIPRWPSWGETWSRTVFPLVSESRRPA
jgi:beta-1,4-mannosyltransferase